MLVICNGTFKSGSSWLHAIILEIFRAKSKSIKSIPEKYNPNLNSPTRILEKKIFDFLKFEDFITNHYVTKSHYFSKKVLNKNYSDNVKFIFIQRDIKDAIVSHYYHVKQYRFPNISFDKYFRFIGKFKAYEISLFNLRSKKYFKSDLIFSYTDIKNDFDNTVVNLCKVLGFKDLSKEDILKIKENTSLLRMRNAAKKGKNNYYPELGDQNYKMFRKGSVGEWKKYYNKKSLKLINQIIDFNPPLYIKIFYFFVFTLRRKIGF